MFDRDHIDDAPAQPVRPAEPTFARIHIKRCLECLTPLAGSGGRDVYCAKCRSAVTDGLTWDNVSKAIL